VLEIIIAIICLLSGISQIQTYSILSKQYIKIFKETADLHTNAE
jgi:hypothetical protein